jgi:hypothetical protein
VKGFSCAMKKQTERQNINLLKINEYLVKEKSIILQGLKNTESSMMRLIEKILHSVWEKSPLIAAKQFIKENGKQEDVNI